MAMEVKTKDGWVSGDEKSYTLPQKMAAEFVAVLVLTFTATSQALAGGTVVNAALAVGCTIFVLACSFAHISGALFNPAVTLCIVLCGKMKFIVACCMIFAQLCGSLCGAFLLRAITSEEQFETVNGGATLVNSNYKWWQCFIAETIVTFVLCQTVMNTAVDTSSFTLAPLAIGLTHTMNILGTGYVGSSMNPAPTFGPAVVGSIYGMNRVVWKNYFVYWCAPLIAAFIEAVLYRCFFTRSRTRLT